MIKQTGNSSKTELERLEEVAVYELMELIYRYDRSGIYWLPLKDERIIFNTRLAAVFPNIFNKEVYIERSSIQKFVRNKIKKNFAGFSDFSLMSLSELRKGFLTDIMDKEYYKRKGFALLPYIVVRDDESGRNIVSDGKNIKTFYSKNPEQQALYITRYCVNEKICAYKNRDAAIIAIDMIRNNLLPKEDLIPHYHYLDSLCSEIAAKTKDIDDKGNIKIISDIAKETKNGDEDVSRLSIDSNKRSAGSAKAAITQEVKAVGTEENSKLREKNQIQSDKGNNIKINLKPEEKQLLECDKTRFSYMVYDKDKLYDLQGGHWDIYNEDDAQGRNTYITASGMVARNPLLDVRKNGVAAIDFGTKSTVVVCKNGSSLKVPLRIGTNNFGKAVSDDQYENPTVEEFINIKNFIKDYNAKGGRPDTKWKDLVIANVAQKDMLDNDSVLDTYYSYFSDIKQWAAGQTEAVISDQVGYMPAINNYMNELSEIDLVEIYAYFIGLHINNMNNGIFLNYKLSFPVSFDVDLRERIRKSFEKGIQKSIPEIVQKNDKVFGKFKVRLVASEPASYAACAIQQYKIEIPDDGAVFYGVFDFGGGTSDFDFGLWKNCDDEDSGYTYELHRITSVGDPYLGGENLLEFLTYEVFKDNIEELKKNEITFIRPVFCNRFKGDEMVVAEPQTRIARRNTRVVKEKLRKFWEGNYEEVKNQTEKKNVLEVDLLSRDGDIRNGIILNVDYNKMYNLLKNKITDGVLQFENGRRRAFDQLKNIQKMDWIKKPQYIFLAGNSCKSSIVQDEMNELYKNEIESGEIKIYSPLSSVSIDADSQLYSPNGKTGVAWGLLDIGDSVKFVDNELAQSKKIEFKYCIGINKKNYMVPKITPDSAYGEWIKIVKANKEEVSIYYTDNICAGNNNFPIMQTENFIYDIDEPDDDKYVFIRMVDSSTIEITNATQEKISGDKIFDERSTHIDDGDGYIIETIDLKSIN